MNQIGRFVGITEDPDWAWLLYNLGHARICDCCEGQGMHFEKQTVNLDDHPLSQFFGMSGEIEAIEVHMCEPCKGKGMIPWVSSN